MTSHATSGMRVSPTVFSNIHRFCGSVDPAIQRRVVGVWNDERTWNDSDYKKEALTEVL